MIYLISGNGEPNFGDELITLNWIQYYRSVGYDGLIVVDCKSAEGAETLHGSVPGVIFVRKLKSLATGRGGEISDHVAHGRRYVDEALSSARNVGVGQHDGEVNLAAAKLVHLVGGGYINGAWPNSFSLIGGSSQLARRLGCKVVATGLGMAPLEISSKVDRAAIVEALADFEFLEVRDERTRNLLVDQIGPVAALREGLDDSFLFSPHLRQGSKESKLHLCLFARHLQGAEGERLVAWLRELAKQYERTLFWRCNRADEGAAEIMERALGRITRVYNRPLLYQGLPLSSGDFMVTSRFHPHLLAARSGISGRYLVQSKFYESKHSSVVKLGSSFSQYEEDGEHTVSPEQRMVALDKIRISAKRRVAEEIVDIVRGEF